MGTRNLTIVVLNNEVKVAQYCQWDGYPSGQGVTILKFLQNVNIDDFKTKVTACSWASDEFLNEVYASVGSTNGSLTMAQSGELESKYPQFHRNTGAGILSFISHNGGLGGIKLRDDYDFAGNSLFCEYAYVIDLDKETFEVYLGFNQDTTKNPKISLEVFLTYYTRKSLIINRYFSRGKHGKKYCHDLRFL